MTTKRNITAITVMGLFIFSVSLLLALGISGPAGAMMGSGGMGGGGMGGGMGGNGGGSGWGGFGNFPGWNGDRTVPGYDRETAALQAELSRKRAELDDLLSAEDINVEKARQVQKEINELQNRLAQKRSGPVGRGYGSGMGFGWPQGLMPGYGPGTF